MSNPSLIATLNEALGKSNNFSYCLHEDGQEVRARIVDVTVVPFGKDHLVITVYECPECKRHFCDKITVSGLREMGLTAMSERFLTEMSKPRSE
jgi:hypothetical protein